MPHADSSNDRLRRAFEQLSEDALFTADCPQAERLWLGAHGQLPAEDVARLTDHLAECGACAAAWRTAREFGSVEAAAPTTRGTPARWWPLAAAAVLAIAAALFYRGGGTTTPEEPMQVATPPSAAPSRQPADPVFQMPVHKPEIRVSPTYALTWRGTGDARGFLEDLADALAPYRTDDFATAATRLARVAERYPDTAEPHFYLGASRLLAGDAAGAIPPLERALAFGDESMTRETHALLAAAYERTGDLERARRAEERAK